MRLQFMKFSATKLSKITVTPQSFSAISSISANTYSNYYVLQYKIRQPTQLESAIKCNNSKIHTPLPESAEKVVSLHAETNNHSKWPVSYT